jgi:hypothetical protein
LAKATITPSPMWQAPRKDRKEGMITSKEISA